MTNPADRVEIITSVQRRRRWTASENVRSGEETFEPGMTVSLVARRHGVAPSQLFTWRRLVAQGALTAAGSGAKRSCRRRITEPCRVRCASCNGCSARRRWKPDPQGGVRTRHGVKKTAAAADVAAEGRFPMKTVVEVIG